ncbi:MAG: AAA family ATPase [Cyanobacteria bacterium SBLK]|nr:AAA family ATPase [Cyanobacteria bacterium SBLK]
MRVKQIQFNSFRGIAPQTIEFEENQPTVFIGVNGSGKSSILDCLAIMLSWLTSKIRNQSRKGDFFKDEDITNDYQKTINQIIISSKDNETTTWSVTHTREEIEKQSSVDDSQLKELARSIQTKLYNSIESVPIFVYYPTNRAVFDIPLNIPKAQQKFGRKDIYNHPLIDRRIAFEDFFQWFRLREDEENELRLNQNSDYQDRQLKTIRAAIENFLDGFVNLRIRRTPPLRMTIEKNGKILSINQLSDGEKCLLAMVGDLARRLAIANPNLDNALIGQGIILIDEIELHLHPKWQHSIVKKFQEIFPNCQFIITTHSPQVITNIEWVYLLRDTELGMVCERVRSYGKDINRILETLMDTPERQINIQHELTQLFALIDAGNLQEARQLRQTISDCLQEEDPKLVRADWLIRRKEILKR